MRVMQPTTCPEDAELSSPMIDDVIARRHALMFVDYRFRRASSPMGVSGQR